MSWYVITANRGTSPRVDVMQFSGEEADKRIAAQWSIDRVRATATHRLHSTDSDSDSNDRSITDCFVVLWCCGVYRKNRSQLTCCPTNRHSLISSRRLTVGWLIPSVDHNRFRPSDYRPNSQLCLVVRWRFRSPLSQRSALAVGQTKH